MPLGRGVGPIPARVMLVGEAYGEYEERQREPFVGPSGAELNKMLHEAGFIRAECFVSNVVNARPPDNDIGAWVALKKKDISKAHVQLRDKWVLPIVKQGYEQLQLEIAACSPNVIVAFGNLAMWSLTGQWAITKWRGSQLRHDGGTAKVIPTYHPAAILREWSWRAAGLADLRRARRHLESKEYSRPVWNFTVRPSLTQVVSVLDTLEKRLDKESLWIDLDLETRAGHIACCGLSWSRLDALCVPFMCHENKEGYWGAEEEAQIVWMLRRIFCHSQVKVRGQNLLYDCQYIHRHWHFIPRVMQDTMISQHALFSDQPKALAYQASLYCDWYEFWKEDK